jgi:hypothetical protein
MMLVDAPNTISNKQIVDPSNPPPTTPTGENLSPSCPVINDPPAYVNINPESIAVSVKGLTPACIKDTLTFV